MPNVNPVLELLKPVVLERSVDETSKPTKTELKNRLTSYKSIIASKDIALGEEFTQDNLSLKRPGTGISPMKYWSFLGKKSKKNYKAEDLIK